MKLETFLSEQINLLSNAQLDQIKGGNDIGIDILIDDIQG